jgi:SAM-dependent methyltransferase
MKPGELERLSGLLVCPSCHQRLEPDDACLRCETCNRDYAVDRHGFLEFRAGEADDEVYEQDTTGDEYVATQEVFGQRVFDEYLKPVFSRAPFRRVLDAGCGMGMGVSTLLSAGYEAYGIDLPNHAKYWERARKDPTHFFCCDASRLPFPDGSFDIVYSLGVIEHIGTVLGFYTLCDDYWEIRQHYADELLRVARPGGRLIIACPNKHFPIDIQHGPRDDLTPDSLGVRLRARLYDRTGFNVHPTWGRNHLLSYSEARRLFCDDGRAGRFEPLPLRGYFGFSKFDRPSLRPLLALAKLYIDNLPGFLRSTSLNPYMLVEITK